MKRASVLMAAAALIFVSQCFAQNDEFFFHEYSQNLDSNKALGFSDPALIDAMHSGDARMLDLVSMQSTAEGIEEEIPSPNQMEIGVSSTFSKTYKSLTLPLSYSRRSWNLSGSIPFVLQKKTESFGSTVSATGLGDISLFAAYSKDFKRKKTHLGLRAGIKLPTGDKEANDEGFPIPLGTGSLDYIFSASFDAASLKAIKMNRLAFSAQALYRLNGKAQRQAMGSEFETKLGDVFSLSTLFAYPLIIGPVRMAAVVGPSLLIVQNGETVEKWEIAPGQDTTVTHTHSTNSEILDLTGGVIVPLRTVGLSWPGSIYPGVSIPLVADDAAEFTVFLNLQVGFIKRAIKS